MPGESAAAAAVAAPVGVVVVGPSPVLPLLRLLLLLLLLPLYLSLSRSLSSASPQNSLFSRTRDRVGIYIKIFAFSSEEKLPSPLAYYSSSLLFFLIPSRLPVVCSRATWLILPVAYACLKD